jgi:hypothetical protein
MCHVEKVSGHVFVLGVSVFPFFIVFLLDFITVQTVLFSWFFFGGGGMGFLLLGLICFLFYCNLDIG